MADLKITQLTEATSPINADLLAVVQDVATTPVTKKITWTTLKAFLKTYFDTLFLPKDLTAWVNFNAPEGFLINGKIIPSVATDDLTVSIKGMDGNDPSATNPVYCRIGGIIRSITGALSATKNDGTNWFNAGSNELATKEIDYFVYLGYNATDGVVVGFSRIPTANIYSDFSTTTTNERYCAISDITTAAAGDQYVIIGRFAATLSATAAFTWTVPTFTPINLIQKPIYKTRWLTWSPTYTADASMTYTSVTTNHALYKIDDKIIYFKLDCVGTTGGTASTKVIFTFPYLNVNNNNSTTVAFGKIYDAGNITPFIRRNVVGDNLIYVEKAINWGLGASREIRITGFDIF